MFVSEIIDEVIEILGRCDRVKALRRITEAVKALQDEGDWKANIGVLDIRSFSDENLITLPREVETPLAVAVSGRPVFMRDEFYRFHLNGEGLLHPEHVVPWAWDDVGIVPTFMDIKTPGPLVCHCDLPSDSGKWIRILGRDHLGHILRQQTEDGQWIDGVVLEMIPDMGVPIASPDVLALRRVFSPTPVSLLSSLAEDHHLVTGQLVQVELSAGSVPSPLVEGGRYYVRAKSNKTVSLYNTRLDSQTNQSPISLVSTDSATVLNLTDRRNVSTLTDFSFVGDPISPLDKVRFASSLAPIDIAKEYVAMPSSVDRFTLYGNEADATAGQNAINVTESGTVTAKILKLCSPLTLLNFGVHHNMMTGDAVTAASSGGQLPAPLLESTTYYARKISDYSLSLHSSQSDSVAGINPIVLLSEGTGTNTLVKLLPATTIPGDTGNVQTTLPHNLNSPMGSGAVATAYFTSGTLTSIIINSAGGGYEAAPFIEIPGANTTPASAYAVVSNGQITAINIIEGGTGYSDDYVNVTITPAGGSFVRFASDGILPAPISQGVVYRAETPMTSTSFTLHDLAPKKINITSTGSGNLFLVISRSFSVGYLPAFKTDSALLSTGQAVKLFTEGLYPIASPPINGEDEYYVRKISGGDLIELYVSQSDATDLTSNNGRIVILSRGSSDLFLFTERVVTAEVRENRLAIEYSGFFGINVPVEFETTDELPSPLAGDTVYLARILEGYLEVKNSDETPLILTGIGKGTHTMVAKVPVDPDEISSITVPNQQYAVGAKITLETKGELPEPLQTETDYFLRPISEDALELYDTKEHAEDSESTDGRISILSLGTPKNYLVGVVPAPIVAEVQKIEKELTSGYARIYCWDTGRDNNLALLGDLHPTERTPTYRRIRVAKKSEWVRMKCRLRAIDLFTERDFINLDSKMALLLMVQSHELLLKKFFNEAERYRISSVGHLNRRNRSLEGPRSVSFQIDADILGNPEDAMIG